MYFVFEPRAPRPVRLYLAGVDVDAEVGAVRLSALKPAMRVLLRFGARWDECCLYEVHVDGFCCKDNIT